MIDVGLSLKDLEHLLTVVVFHSADCCGQRHMTDHQCRRAFVTGQMESKHKRTSSSKRNIQVLMNQQQAERATTEKLTVLQ